MSPEAKLALGQAALAREAILNQLAQRSLIEVQSLADLDSLGRFDLISRFWDKCHSTTKESLRADPCKQVRLMAIVATTQEKVWD